MHLPPSAICFELVLQQCWLNNRGVDISNNFLVIYGGYHITLMNIHTFQLWVPKLELCTAVSLVIFESPVLFSRYRRFQTFPSVQKYIASELYLAKLIFSLHIFVEVQKDLLRLTRFHLSLPHRCLDLIQAKCHFGSGT